MNRNKQPSSVFSSYLFVKYQLARAMNVSPAASLADDLTNNNTMDCDDGFIAKPLHAFSGILRRANSCAVPSSFETSFDMNIFCTTNNEKQSVDIKQESFLSRFVSSLPPTQEQNDDDLLQTSSATNTTTEETTMMLMTPNEVCHYETDMKNMNNNNININNNEKKQEGGILLIRRSMTVPAFTNISAVEGQMSDKFQKEYNGVYRRPFVTRWESFVELKEEGKRVELGSFTTRESAARAHDAALIKIKGTNDSDAMKELNFPLSDYEEIMNCVTTENVTNDDFFEAIKEESGKVERRASRYRGVVKSKENPGKWEARFFNDE